MKYSNQTSTAIDTCVLINFWHIGQLWLLGKLLGYRFVIPEDVYNEITHAEQKLCINAQIEAGNLDRISIEDIDTLTLRARLRKLVKRGEAACLALAKTKGYHLASDEKGVFRREAIKLIGKDKILRTEDLLIECIRNNLIAVDQADEYKAVLADNKYTMSFKSFAELL